LTTLEERLKKIEAGLAVHKRGLDDFEKRNAAQITPAFQSRAVPVVVVDVSKDGILPADIERAISARLEGTIGENDLYKALGLIRRRYD
jgi:hypothetical protein